MHTLQPFHRWLQYYDVADDEQSPFYGKQYNYDLYSDTIYGYYIDPAWDYMGSDTLYIKILYTDYDRGYTVIEMIGEWNDALYNDIMHFKRNIIDHMLGMGINQYILIGENVMNFHGSDDCYYEEWFEEVEDMPSYGRPGWIAAVNFRDFVMAEWDRFNIGSYVNFGGSLDIDNWRTMLPPQFYELVNKLITRRIELI
ncbi:MAG: hypothetical protein WBB45_17675 [Cyclobacteriaceae bacterium]